MLEAIFSLQGDNNILYSILPIVLISPIECNKLTNLFE